MGSPTGRSGARPNRNAQRPLWLSTRLRSRSGQATGCLDDHTDDQFLGGSDAASVDDGAGVRLEYAHPSQYGILYILSMSSRLESVPATAPLTEVRSNLSEIVDEIDRTGTQCVITKSGRPVAVIVSNDEYESLVETLNILSDSDTMTAIAQGEAEFAAGEFVRLDEI